MEMFCQSTFVPLSHSQAASHKKNQAQMFKLTSSRSDSKVLKSDVDSEEIKNPTGMFCLLNQPLVRSFDTKSTSFIPRY